MDLKQLTNRVKELVGKRGGGGGMKPDGADVGGAQTGGGAAPGEPYPGEAASPQTGADQPGVTGTQTGTPDAGLDANEPDAADRDVGGPGAEQTP